MYIFVDESGQFVIANKKHSVSCVAALVIPEKFIIDVCREFKKIKSHWGVKRDEVKGSKLNEKQVSNVVDMLSKYEVLFVVSCIDMPLHSEAEIKSHKDLQVDRFLQPITEQMHANLKRQITQMAEELRSLSNQLYVQALILNDVVNQVIRLSTLYFCQRSPETLAQFQWIIDAKQKEATRYEKLWSNIVSPYLQYESLKEPLAQLKEGDYSFFKKFEQIYDEPPQHLKSQVKKETGPFLFLDVSKILNERLKFAESHRYLGLQLIDILANAFRRACNGNLQEEGWRNLGKLMVQNKKGGTCVKLITLNPRGKLRVPYGPAILHFDRSCKQMLLTSYFV